MIENNDIIIDNDEYEGTAGLWELITSKNPDSNIYTEEDYNNYVKLMLQTNALHRDNNPNNKYPKSSKGDKWKNILSPIWNKRKEYDGSGMVMSCDPNALIERLDLLLASKKAGNTGVRNKLVSICDELKRLDVIDSNAYKKNNVSSIKKYDYI